jgi:hypothetical protein
MWLADVIAILALFVPYLRTFRKVRTIALEDTAVPAWIPKGKRFKLRNTLALWDVKHETIWLRPRGFNFLRVAGVGRLLTERGHIVAADICKSSGFPIWLGVFFVSAIFFFSGSLSWAGATVFVGFALLMSLIAWAIFRKRIWSRIELLVKDALQELREDVRPRPSSTGF